MSIDYSKYRHLGKADGIAEAIDCLFENQDAKQLHSCFNVIDNCAIVQGRLYELMFPVVQEILNRLSTVYKTEFNGLPEIIGMLSDVSGGWTAKEETEAGNDVKSKCLELLKSHSFIFLHLIENENKHIREWSMVVLANCCLYEYDKPFFVEVFEEFSKLCKKYEDFNRLNNLQTGFIHLVKTAYSTDDGKLPEISSLMEAQGYGHSHVLYPKKVSNAGASSPKFRIVNVGDIR